MILTLAVIAGLIAGLVRAWFGKRSLQSIHIRYVWLVPVAFLPQYFAFHYPATRAAFSDLHVAVALVSSQVLLLIFTWANRHQPWFWALGFGLALNLTVILLNGGMMPIRPEVINNLASKLPPDAWQIGSRLGTGKDIVLPLSETKLWWLSDYFTLPAWLPYRVAFSIGDLFIAAGAYGVLWRLGAQPSTHQNRRQHECKLRFQDHQSNQAQ